MLQLLSTGLDWTTEGWASLSSAFGNHIRRFEEHQEYSTPTVAIQMLNQFVNNHDISVAFEDTNAAVEALDSSTYEDMKKMFDCHQVTTTRSLNCNHQGTVVNSHSITFRVALPDNLTDLLSHIEQSFLTSDFLDDWYCETCYPPGVQDIQMRGAIQERWLSRSDSGLLMVRIFNANMDQFKGSLRFDVNKPLTVR